MANTSYTNKAMTSLGVTETNTNTKTMNMVSVKDITTPTELSKNQVCNSMYEDKPQDVFFHRIEEKINNITVLEEKMILGLQKYIDYVSRKIDDEELYGAMDRWFEHDCNKNDYFDSLLDEDDADEFFERVVSKLNK